VPLVGIGLTEAGHARIGIELDDRPQGVRLVHADRVQQRRVIERDRGDPHSGDPDGTGHHPPALTSERAVSTRSITGVLKPSSQLLASSASLRLIDTIDEEIARRRDPRRQTRSRIRELERLNPGMKVTLTPVQQAA
jgi:hypothetical protein